MNTVARIALAVLLLGGTAWASAFAATEEATSPSEAPAAAASEQHSIVELVLQQLAADAAPRDEREQRDRDALRAFYERPQAEPVWVSEVGLSERAQAVAAELARADAFGLDPDEYRVPPPPADRPTPERLARSEVAFGYAVLKYARHAKGGRVEPARINHQLYTTPAVLEPATVLDAVATSSEPAEYLRSLHPSHPQFAALVAKLAELRGNDAGAPQVRLPDGPILRLGVSHEQVTLLRKRLRIVEDGADVDDTQFTPAVEVAVRAFQSRHGLTVDGIVGPGTRRALNGDSNDKQILKILLSMERWRWLPDDLDEGGNIHVWANIPEFRVRIVKAGETVFDERAIMGKVNKQTPVFSDQMEWIEIHPTWYVPDSIKVEDILPSLRRPTSRVMERYHLQLDCGRYGRDPRAIDWSAVDIRKCSVTQPPGDRSVLGLFKFKFPNDHDVYMHDTPTVALFNHPVRMFSHGCIRVRNPQRMAEILLANDKGMGPERISAIVKGPRRLHKEDLNRSVPVHITYFTAVVDETGKLKTLPDYYGHDRRLALALTGTAEALGPAPQAPARARVSSDDREPPAADTNWRRRVLMLN